MTNDKNELAPEAATMLAEISAELATEYAAADGEAAPAAAAPAKAEDTVPAGGAEDTVAGGEDTVEAGEGDEEDEGDTVEAGEGGAKPSEPKKEKSKLIPRGRFDEVVDEKNKYKGETEHERKQRIAAEKQRDEYAEIIRKMKDPEKAKKEDENFEPLDQEAYDRTQNDLKKVEHNLIVRDFKRVITATESDRKKNDPLWTLKKQAVVEDTALHLVSRGIAKTEEEARNLAKAEFAEDLARWYENGEDIGAMIDRRAHDAVNRHAKPQEEKETKVVKKSLTESKPAVKMDKLEALRESAGASNNKTVNSVEVALGGSVESLMQEAYQEVEKQSFR